MSGSKIFFFFLIFAVFVALTTEAPSGSRSRHKGRAKASALSGVHSEEDDDSEENSDASKEASEESSEDASDEEELPEGAEDFRRATDEVEDWFDEEELEEAVTFAEGDDDEFADGGGTGILDPKRKWPKKDGLVVVPYTIDRSAGISKKRAKKIEDGLARIAGRTCVRFKKRTNEKNFIQYTSLPDKGCSSPVGMNPDKPNAIKLNVDESRCYKIGTIIHETIHSLGFGHMHAHPSRDRYVEILWQNIKDGPKNKNMRTYHATMASDFGTKYDFFSVMHYPPGSEDSPKILPRPKFRYYEDFMGQRLRLSDGDVERINNMYGCDESYRHDAPSEYDDYDSADEEDAGEDDDSEEESAEENSGGEDDEGEVEGESGEDDSS